MKSYILTFSSKISFLSALHMLSHQQHWKVTTHTNFDLEDADKILTEPVEMPIFRYVAMAAAMSGIALALLLQWGSAAYDLPLNIGGRPLASWPTYVPITFILMILCSALAIFGLFLYKLKLPWLSHPIFFTESFDLSRDHYQIFIELWPHADDPDKAVAALNPGSLDADRVEEVPCD